jgi:hypothetical protein
LAGSIAFMANEIPDRTGWLSEPLASYPPVPPFPNFTPFEAGVLECVARQSGPYEQIFRQQIMAARVVDRINTIVGFYTRVSINRAEAPPLPELRANLCGVQTELAEANWGLVFILRYENGFLDDIEGALNYSGEFQPDEDTLGDKSLGALTLCAVVFDDGTRMDAST